MDKKKASSSAWRALGLVTNIGITLAASVLIGYYMGYYLDRLIFHKTGYWLTLVFSLFGIAAGFRGVFRMINRTLGDGNGDGNGNGNGGNKE